MAYGKALLENAISTSDVLGKSGDKDGPELEDGTAHIVHVSAMLTRDRDGAGGGWQALLLLG